MTRTRSPDGAGAPLLPARAGTVLRALGHAWRRSPLLRFGVTLTALGALAVLVLLQPVTTQTTSGLGVVRQNQCGLVYFIAGHDTAPEVTESCRGAFAAHAFGSLLAALAGLAGVIGAARALTGGRHRADGPADARAHLGRPPLGSATTFREAVRLASKIPQVRWLAALVVPLNVLTTIASRPVQTITDDGVEVRRNMCGVGYQLWGAGDPVVTHACREAYAGRFTAAIVLAVAAIAVQVGLMRVIAYLRGRRLAHEWESPEASTLFVGKVAAGCSAAIIVALLLMLRPSQVTAAAMTSVEPPAIIAPAPTVATVTLSEPPLALPLLPEIGMPAGPSPTVALVAPRPSAVPLRIVDTAWFSARPAVLDALLISEGSLPVAVTGGSEDKRAYFRVQGTGKELVLKLADGLLQNRFPELASLKLCPVGTSRWTAVQGGVLADAPALDDDACAAVPLRADRWIVDLGRWPDRGGDRGFALVPAERSSDFQVTLVPA